MTQTHHVGIALHADWTSHPANDDFWSWVENAPIDFIVLGLDPSDQHRLEPTVAAAALQARHPALRTLVAISAQREHPYSIARRIASIDLEFGGRIGWLALDRDQRVVGDRAQWADAPLAPETTDDAIDAVIALWHTWPRESIVADRERGVFIESKQIRFADHDGIFRSQGPLNVPSSVQGHPAVATLDHSAAAADFTVVTDAAQARSGDWLLASPATPKETDHLRRRVQKRESVILDLTRVDSLAELRRLADPFLSTPSGADGHDPEAPQPTTLREQLGLSKGLAPKLGGQPYARTGARPVTGGAIF